MNYIKEERGLGEKHSQMNSQSSRMTEKGKMKETINSSYSVRIRGKYSPEPFLTP